MGEGLRREGEGGGEGGGGRGGRRGERRDKGEKEILREGDVE